MQKQTLITPKGMNRDIEESKINSSFAYELVNMRILNDEEHSFLSIENEKGTTKLNLNAGDPIPENGKVVGHCSTGDSIVIFIHTENNGDFIYNITDITIDSYNSIKLFPYSGHSSLGWNDSTKLETLFCAETEDINKVYWLDGYTPLHAINISASNEERQKWNKDYFTSVLSVDMPLEVDIERGTDGIMYAGTVQYCVTLFSDNGKDSAPIYVSPIYYITNGNQGGDSNEQCAASFTVKIRRTSSLPGASNKVRVYKIYRSSKDGIPEVTLLSEGTKELEDYEQIFIDHPIPEYKYSGNTDNTTILSVYKKPYGTSEAITEDMTLDDFNELLGEIPEELKDQDTTLGARISVDTAFGTVIHTKIDNGRYESRFLIPFGEVINTRIIIPTVYSTITRTITESFNFHETVYTVPQQMAHGSGSNAENRSIINLPSTTSIITSTGKTLYINFNNTTDTLIITVTKKGFSNRRPLNISFQVSGNSTLSTELGEYRNNTLYTVYKDVGDPGVAQESSSLLFKGVNVFVPKTMTSKENVLFLGNIELLASESIVVPEHIKQILKECIIDTTTTKSIPFGLKDTEGSVYKYTSRLSLTNNDTTHYKGGDRYRFGVQLQMPSGNWSNPVWIMDKDIDIYPRQLSSTTLLSMPSTAITDSAIREIRKAGYIAIRPLVVFPSTAERKVVSQGVVCPTVYNLKDRKDGSTYAQASWFMRPNVPADIWNLEYPYHKTIVNSQKISPSLLFHKSDLLWQETPYCYFGYTSDEDVMYRGFDTGDTSGNPLSFISVGDLLCDEDFASGIYIDVDEETGMPIPKKHGVLYDSSYDTYTTTSVFKTAYSDVGNLRINDSRLDPITPSRAYRTSYKSIDSDSTSFVPEINSTLATNAILTDRFEILRDRRSGSWVEFRHNYALRGKGWTPGYPIVEQKFSFGTDDFEREWAYSKDILVNSWKFPDATGSIPPAWWVVTKGQVKDKQSASDKRLIFTFFNYNMGGTRMAEIDTSRMGVTIPVNRFHQHPLDEQRNTLIDAWRNVNINNWAVGSAAYYVDSSIVTLNTPELEVSSLLNELVTDDLKFRVIGMIPITGTVSSLYTEDEKAAYNPNGESGVGPNETKIRIENFGMAAFRGMVANNYYYSGGKGPKQYFNSSNDTYRLTAVADGGYINHPEYNYAWYPLYPWQAAGSISDTDPNANTQESILKKKSIANIRFSACTLYFTNYKEWSITGDEEFNNHAYNANNALIGWKPVNGASVGKWIDNVASMIELRPIGYKEESLRYRGNISSIATLESTGRNIRSYDSIYGRKLGPKEQEITKVISDYPASLRFTDRYKAVSETGISYTSSPHWVVAFNPVLMSFAFSDDVISNKCQEILPTLGKYNQEGYTSLTTNFEESLDENTKATIFGRLYEDETIGSLQHQASISFNVNDEDRLIYDMYPITNQDKNPINYGWLWLGEIYRENNPTFGGDTEEALLLNTWLVGGNSVRIPTEEEGIPENMTINWTRGDTYFQRFDTMKTYAGAESDKNIITDITSYMTETYINIDGRYDGRREWEDATSHNKSNFNLINDAYSQLDNYFSYTYTDENIAERKYFPTQVVWSLPKVLGDKYDEWLNVSIASSLFLPGKQGDLTALREFNGNILAFQQKGIAEVLYNSRVQIATSENTPIQIANSEKVEGYKYVSSSIGCQDKHTIISSPNGLYFIDYISKTIYRISNTIEAISDTKGFYTWCQNNLHSNSKIRGYYDSLSRDILYINDDIEEWDVAPCLAYNEQLNSFSSFYSYSSAFLVPTFTHPIWVTTSGKLFSHRTGPYNKLLDDYYPHSITLICNGELPHDKVFNTVEFKYSAYDVDNNILPSQCFDHLQVWTEFQNTGKVPLNYSEYRVSNLKKKFNVWRAQVPRELGSMKRIRYPWSKIKLITENQENLTQVGRRRMHDLLIHYSI